MMNFNRHFRLMVDVKQVHLPTIMDFHVCKTQWFHLTLMGNFKIINQNLITGRPPQGDLWAQHLRICSIPASMSKTPHWRSIDQVKWESVKHLLMEPKPLFRIRFNNHILIKPLTSRRLSKTFAQEKMMRVHSIPIGYQPISRIH